MSPTALGPERAVTLSPVHLVRAGAGLDAVRVNARGFGLLFTSAGVFVVRGNLATTLFTRSRLRALYLGTRGVSWASVALPAPGALTIPHAPLAQSIALPAVGNLPSLDLDLTVRPPEPP